ncbi:MAG: acyl carrier protein [Acidobacteriota bacterium]
MRAPVNEPVAGNSPSYSRIAPGKSLWPWPCSPNNFAVFSHADDNLTDTLMIRSASASIEAGVFDVLKRVSREPIEPTVNSDLVTDLGFDSLQILELIAELEDRFDISIPLNDLPATRTVAQVVAQVTALVEGRAAV